VRQIFANLITNASGASVAFRSNLSMVRFARTVDRHLLEGVLIVPPSGILARGAPGASEHWEL
jgi:hypothetical protein